jgi:hypothetical protein
LRGSREGGNDTIDAIWIPWIRIWTSRCERRVFDAKMYNTGRYELGEDAGHITGVPHIAVARFGDEYPRCVDRGQITKLDT